MQVKLKLRKVKSFEWNIRGLISKERIKLSHVAKRYLIVL
jgi:hypothetical protein